MVLSRLTFLFVYIFLLCHDSIYILCYFSPLLVALQISSSAEASIFWGLREEGISTGQAGGRGQMKWNCWQRRVQSTTISTYKCRKVWGLHLESTFRSKLSILLLQMHPEPSLAFPAQTGFPTILNFRHLPAGVPRRRNLRSCFCPRQFLGAYFLCPFLLLVLFFLAFSHFCLIFSFSV